jgi:hypothetical protein
MSQTTTNKEATTATTANNKKPYHSPQLKKLGDVSELTHTTQSFSGSDGGSGLSQYAS